MGEAKEKSQATWRRHPSESPVFERFPQTVNKIDTEDIVRALNDRASQLETILGNWKMIALL
jgi:hypothetical protein